MVKIIFDWGRGALTEKVLTEFKINRDFMSLDTKTKEQAWSWKDKFEAVKCIR